LRRFSALYADLDATTRTSGKLAALEAYFREAPAADAAWAVHFLSGNRPKRLIRYPDLRVWAAEAAGIPDWLLEECRYAVGDLAETVALLSGPGSGPGGEGSHDVPLHRWVEERLLPLGRMEREDQREALLAVWSALDERETFVWNKLITGAFRVGVSRKLVTRALAAASGIDEATIAHRLMGAWHPTPEAYEALFAEDTADADISRPYPFFLAHPLEIPPSELDHGEAITAELGDRAEWQAEWKWDGIRAQLVRREGLTFLWSRGEDLVTERFPEIEAAATRLADGTVLDGEIMGWSEGAALPFSALQRRIGRKTLGPKILSEVPVVLLAFDLLEEGGEDLRQVPLAERRARLEALVQGLPGGSGAIGLALVIDLEGAESWEALAEERGRAREVLAEGLMVKRLDSAYGVGRRRGPWWKWKVDPFSIDAVLIYAQRGSGRRASLYTDYTFGVWDGDALVPVAKAYSGLTDMEIRRVDRFVRTHTVERFGPVRSVAPELVFELHFEGIRESSRHKSGVALRFPRMARWREDKGVRDADTLEGVRALLEAYGG
jgi:DNA ligase 1